MSIENELKDLILSRYKSVREFSNLIDMPYSTIDSIFKRGVGNASITNIIKICETLQISADDLARGKIVHRETESKNPISPLSSDEIELLNNYRELNKQGKEYIRQTMYMARQTYIKNNSSSDMEASGI